MLKLLPMFILIVVGCSVFFLIWWDSFKTTKKIVDTDKRAGAALEKASEKLDAADKSIKEAKEKEEPKPKMEEPKKKIEMPTSLGVAIPNLDCDWLYDEQDGQDLFRCGDFKIYSPGDVWVGTLDTKISWPLFYNGLVRKFAHAAFVNKCKVDLALCVPIIPPKPKKTKKNK